MTTVFIAGSLKIKKLDDKVTARIDRIVDSDFDVVLGDAEGADSAVQEYLSSRSFAKVTVFSSCAVPRNNLGDWPVRNVQSAHKKGSRAFFTAKDVLMAEVADFGLMIWDSKSTGTLKNIIELLSRQKKAVVYLHKQSTFKNVTDIEALEQLLECMTKRDRERADEKIRLLDRFAQLRNQQSDLAIPSPPNVEPTQLNGDAERLRKEEEAALERERASFRRRQAALVRVRREFLPNGSGTPSFSSLEELEKAEEEWRAARAHVDRIVEEIRFGKRR